MMLEPAAAEPQSAAVVERPENIRSVQDDRQSPENLSNVPPRIFDAVVRHVRKVRPIVLGEHEQHRKITWHLARATLSTLRSLRLLLAAMPQLQLSAASTIVRGGGRDGMPNGVRARLEGRQPAA